LIQRVDVLDFVRQMQQSPVVDVRTSSEYRKGHIPGAISMPLFSDDERAEIGTVYKQVGRFRATQVGLEMVGPRLSAMVDNILEKVDPGPVLVHCWRGGMRSESIAWLMSVSDQFTPSVLRGGYKSYRRFALEQFATHRRIRILGGMTGTGKTRILNQLAESGAQVIDLEALASHRGSAFGAIGQPEPPTQQQFENELALALHRTDPDETLWLEDESRYIGRRIIPDALWIQMRGSPVKVVEKSREERVDHLVAEYGSFDRAQLARSIQKIERRLGGVRALEAREAIERGDLAEACNLVLDYYDRTYRHGLGKRDTSSISTVDVSGRDPQEVADWLIENSDS
jgi:tRNA 2-selenouridine synthase